MSKEMMVLRHTYKSADVIVTTLYQFGGGNLGNGVRRLYKVGLQRGFIIGRSKGRLEGVAATLGVIGAVKLTVKGIKKINAKKEDSNNESIEGRYTNE